MSKEPMWPLSSETMLTQGMGGIGCQAPRLQDPRLSCWKRDFFCWVSIFLSKSRWLTWVSRQLSLAIQSLYHLCRHHFQFLGAPSLLSPPPTHSVSHWLWLVGGRGCPCLVFAGGKAALFLTQRPHHRAAQEASYNAQWPWRRMRVCVLEEVGEKTKAPVCRAVNTRTNCFLTLQDATAQPGSHSIS